MKWSWTKPCLIKLNLAGTVKTHVIHHWIKSTIACNRPLTGTSHSTYSLRCYYHDYYRGEKPDRLVYFVPAMLSASLAPEQKDDGWRECQSMTTKPGQCYLIRKLPGDRLNMSLSHYHQIYTHFCRSVCYIVHG